MYKGLLHTHLLSVILFLIVYLIKTSLLLTNKREALAIFTKKVKVPEMILSVLFLFTGIYLLMHTATIDSVIYFKLLAVAISIPLAIVGFKKGSKILATLSLFLLIMAYGFAEMHGKRVRQAGSYETVVPDGKVSTGITLYEQNCVRCHGDKGDAGLSGAIDLSRSNIGPNAKEAIIKQGKGAMPAYGTAMSQTQIDSLVVYIETLRKRND
jgi:uncharacterized membrane protein SirB2